MFSQVSAAHILTTDVSNISQYEKRKTKSILSQKYLISGYVHKHSDACASQGHALLSSANYTETQVLDETLGSGIGCSGT